MMNLVARTPSFVSSPTSVSPGKRYYGNQDPWKSVAGEDRPGQLGKGTDLLESFSSTDDSKLDYDRVWSSQEWRAEATTHGSIRGNLIKLLGEWYNKFDLVTRKFFSTEPRNP